MCYPLNDGVTRALLWTHSNDSVAAAAVVVAAVHSVATDAVKNVDH